MRKAKGAGEGDPSLVAHFHHLLQTPAAPSSPSDTSTPLAQDLPCQEEFTTPGTQQQDLLSPAHTPQQSMRISTKKGIKSFKIPFLKHSTVASSPVKHLPWVGQELLYPDTAWEPLCKLCHPKLGSRLVSSAWNCLQGSSE